MTAVNVNEETLALNVCERINKLVVDAMHQLAAACQADHTLPQQPRADCIGRGIPQSDLGWNPSERNDLLLQRVCILLNVPDVTANLCDFVDFDLLDA